MAIERNIKVYKLEDGYVPKKISTSGNQQS